MQTTPLRCPKFLAQRQKPDRARFCSRGGEGSEPQLTVGSKQEERSQQQPGAGVCRLHGSRGGRGEPVSAEQPTRPEQPPLAAAAELAHRKFRGDVVRSDAELCEHPQEVRCCRELQGEEGGGGERVAAAAPQNGHPTDGCHTSVPTHLSKQLEHLLVVCWFGLFFPPR